MRPTSTHNASTAGAVDLVLAGFGLGAIVVHDLGHFREGRGFDALWLCNVAAILPGIALLVRSRLLAGVALTWLVPGSVVWLADVALGGGTILETSWGIHIGGSLVSGWAVLRLGRSRGAFFGALALLVGCFVLSVLFVPEHANVNAAHRVPPAWTFFGESRGVFLLTSLGLAIAAALFGQLLAAGLDRAGRSLRV